MSQEANNWAHTSERGNPATALAGVTGGPSVMGGAGQPLMAGGAQPMVNSAELRPYQSGRLGLDSEMGVGIDHHGPNGPYPTRPAGVSDPHHQPNLMNKAGVAGQHNEIAIPVTSGPTGTALLANHPNTTNLTSNLRNTDRNHDGIPDSQQRIGGHHSSTNPIAYMSGAGTGHGMDLNRDGIPDSQQSHMPRALDKNRDGHIDALQRDRNHDGIPDSQQRGVVAPLGVGAGQSATASTYSGAHPASGVNTTGLGVFGSAHGHHSTHGAPNTSHNLKDKNHDGIPDSQQHVSMGEKLKNMLPGANKDKNHDGIPDKQQRDRNHDGIPDNQQHHTTTATSMKDKNHDGIPDSQQHQSLGQKISGMFGGNKDKNHDGIPDNQQKSTHTTTATSTHGAHHGDTVDVSNRPNADIWVPKQFGRMPPGSTIRDPAHHPGFATHVVTENIPVVDELGREAQITKQTIITTQDTIMGLLRRDHELLDGLFQRWFATRDVQQREQIWWEIEHELLSAHEGHNGVLHSGFNKHLLKEDGYDHSSSFRGYNDMHTLTTEMSKMNPSDAMFETKMTQLHGMYNNYQQERSRYLPLMERKLTNQQLIDMGTAYNLKKSGVKNTKHASRLNQHNTTSTSTSSTHGHTLSERDREHTMAADKHADRNHDGIPDNQQHKTMGQKIAGIFGGNKDKNHDGIPDNQQHGVNTSTHTAHTATTTAPRK